MLIRLAWRNLWRQKRRTLITSGAIALALALSLFMRSMQEGSYSHNIDSAARSFTGLLQLQHPKYFDDESIDYLLPATAAFIAPAKADPSFNHILPRLQSFTLAAYGQRSKGAMLIGVDPELEAAYSKLDERLIAGEYLEPGSLNQLLIGRRLAEYLRVSPGDELVLYGQGYHGQTAAGLFQITGVIEFPLPQLDAQIIYLTLPGAQQLLSTGEQVSAWLLHTASIAQLPTLQQQLTEAFAEQAAIVHWRKLAPELDQQIQLDRVSGQFLVGILYGVVGFGLLATLVMMTLERQREFAVMLASGMSRAGLQGLLLLESAAITALGVLLGLVIVMPLLLYFYGHPIELTGETAAMIREMGYEPIIPFSLAPALFAEQISAVLCIAALCLIYPLLRVQRLVVPTALKGG